MPAILRPLKRPPPPTPQKPYFIFFCDHDEFRGGHPCSPLCFSLFGGNRTRITSPPIAFCSPIRKHPSLCKQSSPILPICRVVPSPFSRSTIRLIYPKPWMTFSRLSFPRCQRALLAPEDLPLGGFLNARPFRALHSADLVRPEYTCLFSFRLSTLIVAPDHTHFPRRWGRIAA